MVYKFTKVKLDDLSELFKVGEHVGKIADYLLVREDGLVVVVEETSRVKRDDIKQLESTISSIVKNKQLRELLQKELNKYGISLQEGIQLRVRAGIIHFEFRIGSMEFKQIAYLQQNMAKIKVNINLANCREQCEKYILRFK